MTNPLKIKIVGDRQMNCGGCSGNVEFSLKQVAGVNDVRADRTTQTVDVYFDDQVDMNDITAQMTQLGYQIETA